MNGHENSIFRRRGTADVAIRKIAGLNQSGAEPGASDAQDGYSTGRLKL